MGKTTYPVAYYQALQQRPYNFGFYQTLRQLECYFACQPRIGSAQRPQHEPLRLGQTPALTFAPTSLSAFVLPDEEHPLPRLEVNFFGMLGPNGPLPLHLTEYARERIIHGGDETFARFLDVFHHRFLSMFYRAWAQAQPTVNLDRAEEDKFFSYVGALIGLAGKQQRQRDEVDDYAKLHYAAMLSRQIRNADGLAALLSDYFGVAVQVDEFVGHWIRLNKRDRSRLGEASAILGQSTVIGSKVWDKQGKIRLCFGPMSLAQYLQFLPGGIALKQLVVWMRHYLCFELEWDVKLILQPEEVPKLLLGKQGQLGWTSWLGKRKLSKQKMAELTLDGERYYGRE